MGRWLGSVLGLAPAGPIWRARNSRSETIDTSPAAGLLLLASYCSLLPLATPSWPSLPLYLPACLFLFFSYIPPLLVVLTSSSLCICVYCFSCLLVCFSLTALPRSLVFLFLQACSFRLSIHLFFSLTARALRLFLFICMCLLLLLFIFFIFSRQSRSWPSLPLCLLVFISSLIKLFSPNARALNLSLLICMFPSSPLYLFIFSHRTCSWPLFLI